MTGSLLRRAHPSFFLCPIGNTARPREARNGQRARGAQTRRRRQKKRPKAAAIDTKRWERSNVRITSLDAANGTTLGAAAPAAQSASESGARRVDPLLGIKPPRQVPCGGTVGRAQTTQQAPAAKRAFPTEILATRPTRGARPTEPHTRAERCARDGRRAGKKCQGFAAAEILGLCANLADMIRTPRRRDT